MNDGKTSGRHRREEEGQAVQKRSDCSLVGVLLLAAPIIYSGCTPESECDVCYAKRRGDVVTDAELSERSGRRYQSRHNDDGAEQSKRTCADAHVTTILDGRHGHDQVKDLEHQLNDDLAAKLPHGIAIVRVAAHATSPASPAFGAAP